MTGVPWIAGAKRACASGRKAFTPYVSQSRQCSSIAAVVQDGDGGETGGRLKLTSKYAFGEHSSIEQHSSTIASARQSNW